MLRQPVSDRENLPACFGISHDPRGVLCRGCRARSRCAPLTRRWSACPSLSEMCADAERALVAPDLDRTTIERIYDHQYREHFGRRSPRKRSARNDTIFGRLVTLCATEGVDPATYIGANMMMLKEFALSSPYGFQPNMLSGKKAIGRYNAFIRRANRRYRRALSDAAGSSTELGALRRTLMLDEVAVAELYVRARWVQKPISWAVAIERAEPSNLWIDLSAHAGEQYGTWRRRLGEAALDREIRLMRLRAACTVANGFEHGLADRVGVIDFSWDAFSDLICRTFEMPVRATPDLSGVPGGLWR